MAQSPVGLLFRINADPSQAQNALEAFRSKTVSQMEMVRSEFSLVQRGQAAWSSGFLSQASAVDNALGSLGQAATFSFDRFSMGLGRNIGMAAVYSRSMTEALDQTLKATTASIAVESVIQSLRSLALGFYLLAVGNFAGAASAFQSAAIWGSIGGVAAGLGAGIGGGVRGGEGPAGERYGRTAYSPGPSAGPGVSAAALAPGAVGPPARGGNLTVTIMGETEAANWLASTLNRGVSRGIPLTATRTQRGPYAGG
jgi:hypothetical protein